ncbi:MAG: CSLREA domain-containing protein [Acidobacteriota bacterium]|nr:CSLREA domain-containing protein [Acidobacteriota bacterium]
MLRNLRNGAILMATCFIAGPLSANTFLVDSTDDAVDASPGDGSCETAAAVCTLRAAIQEANALAGADAISIPTGVFKLTITGAGKTPLRAATSTLPRT